MNKVAYMIAVLVLIVVAAPSANAATVSIVDNFALSFFDVFYTPSDGQEFAAWDLNVVAAVGGILDPVQSVRSDDTTLSTGGGPALDTFANTVFSSVGAGPASYIFTSYFPGQVFPPQPADPLPAPARVGRFSTRTAVMVLFRASSRTTWLAFSIRQEGVVTLMLPFSRAVHYLLRGERLLPFMGFPSLPL